MQPGWGDRWTHRKQEQPQLLRSVVPGGVGYHRAELQVRGMSGSRLGMCMQTSQRGTPQPDTEKALHRTPESRWGQHICRCCTVSHQLRHQQPYPTTPLCTPWVTRVTAQELAALA